MEGRREQESDGLMPHCVFTFFRPQDHLKVRLLTSQNALRPHLTRHRVGGAHDDICTVTCVHVCATTSLETYAWTSVLSSRFVLPDGNCGKGKK